MCALGRELQPKFAAVVGIFHARDQLVLEQLRDSAADGRLVRPCALRNELRAARLFAKPERRQHAPLRHVDTVLLDVFAGQRGTDLRRETAEAERHELQEVESCHDMFRDPRLRIFELTPKPDWQIVARETICRQPDLSV